MKKTIKWGIVGAGYIANKFAKAIKNVEGAELTAVVSRTEDKCRAFAKTYNIPNVFTKIEDMANSDIVDAVYIATPHPFHKPCAEVFMNAKKHVLCEKPVCVNAAQAEALLECAEKNGVFLMEAMWTRFLPAIEEALKIVNSGAIGDVRGIRADFCYSITYDEEPKLFINDMAGGSLLDVGVYGLNYAKIFLGDDIKSIKAVSDVDGGVDLHTNILVEYNNGATASVSSAINVCKPSTGYIYGTKGYIEMPRFYGAVELFVNVNDEQQHIKKPCIGDGFEEEIIEACNCIREGKIQSDIMPMSESIKMLEQMDYIRKQIGLEYPFDK